MPSKSYRHLLRTLFILAVLAVLYLTLTPNPPQIGPPGQDKWHHALAFWGLGLLACVGSERAAARLMSTFAALAALGGLIEIVQLFVPNRGCELLDWLADMAGAALALAMVALWQRWNRGRVKLRIEALATQREAKDC
jgi:VanZ family protein